MNIADHTVRSELLHLTGAVCWRFSSTLLQRNTGRRTAAALLRLRSQTGRFIQSCNDSPRCSTTHGGSGQPCGSSSRVDPAAYMPTTGGRKARHVCWSSSVEAPCWFAFGGACPCCLLRSARLRCCHRVGPGLPGTLNGPLERTQASAWNCFTSRKNLIAYWKGSYRLVAN